MDFEESYRPCKRRRKDLGERDAAGTDDGIDSGIGASQPDRQPVEIAQERSSSIHNSSKRDTESDHTSSMLNEDALKSFIESEKDEWPEHPWFNDRMKKICARYSLEALLNMVDPDEVNIRTGALEVDRGHFHSRPDPNYDDEDDCSSFTSEEDGIVDDHDDDILDFLRNPDSIRRNEADTSMVAISNALVDSSGKPVQSHTKRAANQKVLSEDYIKDLFGSAAPGVMASLKMQTHGKLAREIASPVQSLSLLDLESCDDDDLSILHASTTLRTPARTILSPQRRVGSIEPEIETSRIDEVDEPLQGLQGSSVDEFEPPSRRDSIESFPESITSTGDTTVPPVDATDSRPLNQGSLTPNMTDTPTISASATLTESTQQCSSTPSCSSDLRKVLPSRSEFILFKPGSRVKLQESSTNILPKLLPSTDLQVAKLIRDSRIDRKCRSRLDSVAKARVGFRCLRCYDLRVSSAATVEHVANSSCAPVRGDVLCPLCSRPYVYSSRLEKHMATCPIGKGIQIIDITEAAIQAEEIRPLVEQRQFHLVAQLLQGLEAYKPPDNCFSPIGPRVSCDSRSGTLSTPTSQRLDVRPEINVADVIRDPKSRSSLVDRRGPGRITSSVRSQASYKSRRNSAASTIASPPTRISDPGNPRQRASRTESQCLIVTAHAATDALPPVSKRSVSFLSEHGPAEEVEDVIAGPSANKQPHSLSSVPAPTSCPNDTTDHSRDPQAGLVFPPEDKSPVAFPAGDGTSLVVDRMPTGFLRYVPPTKASVSRRSAFNNDTISRSVSEVRSSLPSSPSSSPTSIPHTADQENTSVIQGHMAQSQLQVTSSDRSVARQSDESEDSVGLDFFPIVDNDDAMDEDYSPSIARSRRSTRINPRTVDAKKKLRTPRTFTSQKIVGRRAKIPPILGKTACNVPTQTFMSPTSLVEQVSPMVEDSEKEEDYGTPVKFGRTEYEENPGDMDALTTDWYDSVNVSATALGDVQQPINGDATSLLSWIEV